MLDMRRVGISIGLVLIGVAVALFFLYSRTDVERALRRGEPVYVLVVGVDNARHGAPQADLIAVAGLFPGGRTVWVSIPRHLACPTPAGWRPLYALYAAEGVDGLRRRVAGLLELPIDHWVEVDFAGFQKLVDLVGGVEVAVETRLVYMDWSQDLFIDVPAGLQNLSGAKALEYVRYQEGDELGRIARQHVFLQALWDRLRGLSWSRWREVVQVGREAVRTDLSVWEGLDLAKHLRQAGPVVLAAAPVLPRAGGQGEAVPDLVRVHKLVRAVAAGEHFLTRDEVRVLVLNGAGVKFLARKTGAWLLERGFYVTDMSNADRYNYPRTYLIYREETQAKARMLLDLLPPGVEAVVEGEFGVERLGGWPEDTDLILILGAGFDVRS
ncbi:MAG: LCP family protein [Candidatus Acetothermia bacterium]|jgi:LCP family protein required for cell wall assembly|nr:LCP family protein [Candidatus Acetothermia bacterium]